METHRLTLNKYDAGTLLNQHYPEYIEVLKKLEEHCNVTNIRNITIITDLGYNGLEVCELTREMSECCVIQFSGTTLTGE